MSKSSSSDYSDYTSSEDDSAGTMNYIPYSTRPEWQDVKPEPQNDSDQPVASIKYSEKFRETFDYFRAILRLDEKSERAFNLTTDCIHLNASNYTVWFFRRILITHLNKNLKDELTFLNEVILKHQKNYQVWHHREWLVKAIGEIGDEKEFTADIIQLDSKNYHCWQHRQWFVPFFKAWEGEREFTTKLIEKDIRNNSAWNHRFFVIKESTGFTDEIIEEEIDFTLEKINSVPNNESSWSYLRGILEIKKQSLTWSPKVLEFVKTKFIDTLNGSTSPHALAFQVDVLSEKVEKESDASTRKKLATEAILLCDQLGEVNDVVRVTYWKYIGDSLRGKLGE